MLLEHILHSSLHHLWAHPGDLAASLLVLFLSYTLINELVSYKRQLPGFGIPPVLPLVGNLHQLRSDAAQQYRQWSKRYGSVFQIRLGNVPVLVINSAASAKVIFGHNSQATASRPELYTFHKLVSNTAGTTIGTAPYNESLIRRRKGAASALNRPSVESYIPHLDLETQDFVKEILKYGNSGKSFINPVSLVQRLSLSLALTLNWGTRITSQSDELFSEITHVEVEISRFRSTTDNLQDYIPLLRLIPFSFGKRKAAEYRRRRDRYLAKLNGDLDKRIQNGTHQPCIQANVLMDKETKLNNVELTSISLTMLSGGFETFTAVMTWSIALLATRPDIQQKAIKEIRKMYNDRNPLCDAKDDQKCLYVAGIVRESLRYFTVLRLSLPRSTNKEFTYEGKTVPVGTTVFLNSWACNMDPELWEDPEEYRPERWLEHPSHPVFTFGLGYRMCAGSLLAYRELYLTFMRMLSAFEIESEGPIETHPVKGVNDLTSLVSMPREYRVRFVPRDESVLAHSQTTDAACNIQPVIITNTQWHNSWLSCGCDSGTCLPTGVSGGPGCGPPDTLQVTFYQPPPSDHTLTCYANDPGSVPAQAIPGGTYNCRSGGRRFFFDVEGVQASNFTGMASVVFTEPSYPCAEGSYDVTYEGSFALDCGWDAHRNMTCVQQEEFVELPVVALDGPY
ncbi:hypothetical protein FE257_011769 [Aspergillus nanangensis]|uniref:Cytochrome P450 n=1 Tax=Aspergillus nanangensis TaxID=2582783 RepID=A0AAD4GXV4_ASPNN|nr:hypothetical protein FE257_011769 [Aspergillus nanangensis]